MASLPVPRQPIADFETAAQSPLPPAAGFLEVVQGLLEWQLDPDDLGNRDVAFMRAIVPYLFSAGMSYFRAEAEGTENIPETGQFIAVGNHGGVPLLPDAVVLAAWFAMQNGYDRATYTLVHDFPFKIPLVRNLLAKCGAIPASRRNAERVLRAGGSLLCFPAGDVECSRSFWDRDRIDLQGHTGFVELAFQHGVPIVPFVNVGGHEVYITLATSRRLARWTGLERFARVKTIPIIAGLPWGLWVTGFLPYLPLPAKFVYRVGEPIRPPRDPNAASDAEAVRRTYLQVTRVMQRMLDDLAARRRFPVLG